MLCWTGKGETTLESIDREKFGLFLTQLRKEKGFTQQDVADRLYVSNKAVSKWERGQSLPDISLLAPLAQLLEVSVAELLKGERLAGEALDSREVESLVSKAIRLSAEEQENRSRARRFWGRAWVACAALAALETTALIAGNQLSAVELWDFLLLAEGLTLGFGAYFCFFVKEILPAYYDENQVYIYSDRFFRMNLGMIPINNSNWPHIVKVGRGWLLGTAVLWPPVFWAARGFLPSMAMLPLTLFFCLGFFAPMLWTAWRHR